MDFRWKSVSEENTVNDCLDFGIDWLQQAASDVFRMAVCDKYPNMESIKHEGSRKSPKRESVAPHYVGHVTLGTHSLS